MLLQAPYPSLAKHEKHWENPEKHRQSRNFSFARPSAGWGGGQGRHRVALEAAAPQRLHGAPAVNEQGAPVLRCLKGGLVPRPHARFGDT